MTLNATIRLLTMLWISILFESISFSQQWIKVWADEFDYVGMPDSAYWNFDKYGAGDGYFAGAREENVRVEDGKLILEARKENYQGAQYSSAQIHSQCKGDWKYGKIEISAKIPFGRGIWPALWLKPTYSTYGAWPQSGEIDIMEYVGYMPDTIHGTVHFEGTEGSGHKSKGDDMIISQPYNDFHLYALEWSYDSIKWFVDGTMFHSYVKTNDDPRLWPFNSEFFVILDVVVGGWGGERGIDTSIFPQQFIIDYVRVYQKQDKPGPYKLTIEEANNGQVDINPDQIYYPSGSIVNLTAIPDSGYTFLYWLTYGAKNPMQFRIWKDMVVKPVFIKNNELITNGDFSIGLAGWTEYYHHLSTTKALLSAVNSEFTVNVTVAAPMAWEIGVNRAPLTFEKGSTYRLTFDAYAYSNKEIMVSFCKNYDDYITWKDTVFNISSQKKRYSVNFKMNANSDSNCRLYIGFGKDTGTYKFDNISFTKVLPVTPPSPPAKTLEVNSCSGWNVYPNPANSLITVNFYLADRQNVTFDVLSLDGKSLLTFSTGELENGDNSMQLYLDKLGLKGVYILCIKTKNKLFTRKIILH
jgi:beta-glucanase (GH16 family)